MVSEHPSGDSSLTWPQPLVEQGVASKTYDAMWLGIAMIEADVSLHSSRFVQLSPISVNC